MDSNFPQDISNNWSDKNQGLQEGQEQVEVRFHTQNDGKGQGNYNQKGGNPSKNLMREKAKSNTSISFKYHGAEPDKVLIISG